ncbi:uncharacterized protein LOC130810724 [Amaranthus tricolor]|uniref:uncharacterized protein LOC130810724 n=1 Tax=Amaranthus tricolor TaxID=29722 RepID=UPI002590136B|nr:uncharacterized protein LOC130810724 [Amaranthus tricolor]
MEAINNQMDMESHTDASWFKNFILTLTRTAQKWVQCLPKGSISSFPELAEKFRSYFSSRTARTKQSIEMMSIRQGKDESLRNYVSRFDKESFQVLNPEENILTFSFRQGLNSNRPESEALKFSNQWSYLKTLKEVREYAQSHVDVEDFKAITGNMEQKGRNMEKAKKPAETHDKGRKLVRAEDFDVPGLNNYANYTPLKEFRAKIFNVHKEDTRWQRPIQKKIARKNLEAF